MRPKFKKVLLGMVGGFLLLAIAGAVIGSHKSPNSTPTVAAVTATVPSTTMSPAKAEALALSGWWSGFKPRFEVIELVLGTAAKRAQADNEAGLLLSCKALNADVAYAQKYKPAPDPSVSAAIAAALADYRSAANACVAGIEGNDTAEINSATASISAGSAEIGKATAAISRLTKEIS